jgi:two-component system sensor histidine kinase RegB
MSVSDRGDRTPWYLGATRLAALPWLIRLRWSSAVIEAAIVVAALLFRGSDFPLRSIVLLVGMAAAANTAMAAALSSRRSAPAPAALRAAALLADVVLLAGLLDLTGGPFNPFSVVFAVHVTLAALTLGKSGASAIAAVATVALGWLVYDHATVADLVHHRLNDFPTHLFTMWVAAAATAELAAYFVVQASNAVARREAELDRMRQRAERTDRLMSLTTLAAGAAHELSTPLATIALAARELQHAAERRGTVPDLAEDARLIRNEVDRCQAILDQMSGRAGGRAADDPEMLDLTALFAEVRARLSDHQAARLRVELPAASNGVFLPRAGLSQAVFTLIRNAFDASPGTPVVVRVARDDDRLRITVEDRGTGMAEDVLQRAGEPFFTTKQAGQGLGLGLFLARVFAERTGGSLTLRSDAGTIAQLDLPARASDAAGAA